MARPERSARSGRGVAWLALALGAGCSIAANVAHAFIGPGRPSIGAVLASLVWPVLVLVAVELLARVEWPTGPLWATVRYIGVGLVAIVAAIVSYRHMSGLLTHYGEDPVTAALGPIAIDGLMCMATAALLARPGPATAAQNDRPTETSSAVSTAFSGPVRPESVERPGVTEPPLFGEPIPGPVRPEPTARPVKAARANGPARPVSKPAARPVSKPAARPGPARPDDRDRLEQVRAALAAGEITEPVTGRDIRRVLSCGSAVAARIVDAVNTETSNAVNTEKKEAA